MNAKKIRLDNEFPQCVAEWGWKFHHLGVPINEIKENENYNHAKRNYELSESYKGAPSVIKDRFIMGLRQI